MIIIIIIIIFISTSIFSIIIIITIIILQNQVDKVVMNNDHIDHPHTREAEHRLYETGVKGRFQRCRGSLPQPHSMV